MDPTTKAFDQGRRAVGKGVPKSANPHPPNTTSWWAWNSGYDIAMVGL